MKKLLILLVTALVFCLPNAHSASRFDVQEFEASSELGNSAMRGNNYERAYPFLVKAAKLGNKISQFSLALIYLEGLGVEKDIRQAYVWLNVASEVNEKNWRGLRDKIKDAMTKEQLAAIQPKINEYIEKYGAETQEVSCYVRKQTGSNRRQMQCVKYLTLGL